jgi:hypothetical protein
MMRFLYNLHNATVGARQDLINNLLRRTVLRQRNADIPDEAVERANLRILDVKNASDFVFPNEPDVPASAFEVESAIMRQMASLDPNLFSADTGDSSNPMAGKLATTAVMSQRSNDALLQWKLDQLALYDKELSEKDLLMLQAELQDEVKIHDRFSKQAAQHATSTAAGVGEGERTSIKTLSPYEIQEDIDVEPAVGSTLAQDDEFHRMAWERLYQLGQQDPVNWNVNEIAKGYAKCIRGADASKLVNPPSQPPPPLPKVSIAISVKWAELPAGIQEKLMTGQGVQLTPEDLQEMQHQDTLKAVTEMGAAADAAGKLAEPANPDAHKAHAASALALQNSQHAIVQQHHKDGNEVVKMKAAPKPQTKGAASGSR